MLIALYFFIISIIIVRKIRNKMYSINEEREDDCSIKNSIPARLALFYTAMAHNQNFNNLFIFIFSIFLVLEAISIIFMLTLRMYIHEIAEIKFSDFLLLYIAFELLLLVLFYIFYWLKLSLSMFCTFTSKLKQLQKDEKLSESELHQRVLEESNELL